MTTMTTIVKHFLQELNLIPYLQEYLDHRKIDRNLLDFYLIFSIRVPARQQVEFLFVDVADLKIDEDALKQLPENAIEIVAAATASLERLEDFTTDAIHQALSDALVDGMGEKPRNAFGPVRTAISGRRVTPPLFECMEILGKEQSLARLEAFAQSR